MACATQGCAFYLWRGTARKGYSGYVRPATATGSTTAKPVPQYFMQIKEFFHDFAKRVAEAYAYIFHGKQWAN